MAATLSGRGHAHQTQLPFENSPSRKPAAFKFLVLILRIRRPAGRTHRNAPFGPISAAHLIPDTLQRILGRDLAVSTGTGSV